MKTIREKVEDGQLDYEYAEYILGHAVGDRIICNGNTLTVAMEDGYLMEEFIEHMESRRNAAFEKFVQDQEAQRESDESDI